MTNLERELTDALRALVEGFDSGEKTYDDMTPDFDVARDLLKAIDAKKTKAQEERKFLATWFDKVLDANDANGDLRLDQLPATLRDWGVNAFVHNTIDYQQASGTTVSYRRTA